MNFHVSAIRRCFILLVFALLIVLPAAAQQGVELSNLYTAEDGSFAFRYPDGWNMIGMGGLVDVTGPDGQEVILIGPNQFAATMGEMGDMESTMEAVMANFAANFGIEELPVPTPITIGDDREGITVTWEIDGETVNDALIRFSDGSFTLVSVLSGGFDDPVLEAIIASFDTPEAVAERAVPVVVLEAETAVEELVETVEEEPASTVTDDVYIVPQVQNLDPACKAEFDQLARFMGQDLQAFKDGSGSIMDAAGYFSDVQGCPELLEVVDQITLLQEQIFEDYNSGLSIMEEIVALIEPYVENPVIQLGINQLVMGDDGYGGGEAMVQFNGQAGDIISLAFIAVDTSGYSSPFPIQITFPDQTRVEPFLDPDMKQDCLDRLGLETDDLASSACISDIEIYEDGKHIIKLDGAANATYLLHYIQHDADEIEFMEAASPAESPAVSDDTYTLLEYDRLPLYDEDARALVAISVDGTMAASAGMVNNQTIIHIWNRLEDGQLEQVMEFTFNEFLSGLDWSPTGDYLAVLGSSVQIIDTTTGQVARSWTNGSGGLLRSIAWSPQGDLLAISTGGRIVLWDVIQDDESFVLNISDDLIFDPSSDAYFRRDLDTGEEVRLEGTEQDLARGSADFVLWSADGEYILFTHEVTTIRESESGISVEDSSALYRWAYTTAELTVEELVTEDAIITTAVLSPDAAHLAYGLRDSDQIKVLDTETWAIMQELPTDSTFVDHVTWSTDGCCLMMEGNRWDVASGQEQWQAGLYGSPMVEAPGGDYLLDTADGAVLLLRPIPVIKIEGHENSISTYENPNNEIKRITSVAISSSAGFSGGVDGTVRIWDVTNGENLHLLEAHTDEVDIIALSPDGQYLATLGDLTDGRRVLIWDAASGEQLGELAHNEFHQSIAWSPDSSTFAVGYGDHQLGFWDIETMEMTSLFTLQPPAAADQLAWSHGPVRALSWSPDGSRLALNQGDAVIHILDVATGIELEQLAAFPDEYTAQELQDDGYYPAPDHIAWSPDGRYVASANYDVIRIWDVVAGEMLHTMDEGAWWLDWSPDGQYLAIASTYRSEIWLMPIDDTAPTYRLYTDARTVDWSVDQRLIAGNFDGIVSVWQLDFEAQPLEIVTLTETDSGTASAATDLSLPEDAEEIFRETFDDNRNNWETANLDQVVADIVDGRYVVEYDSDRSWWVMPGWEDYTLAPKMTSPYQVEVTFRVVENQSDTAGVGLAFNMEADYAGGNRLDLRMNGTWVHRVFDEGEVRRGTSPVNIETGQTYQLSLQVMPDTVSLLLDDTLVTTIANPYGIQDTIAFGMLGSETGVTRAEFDDLVIHLLPVDESITSETSPTSICSVNAAQAVNQRGGPGTTFAIQGSLEPGTTLDVIGQADGNDGFIWWQLSDSNWVREDVVSTAGDCSNIPQAQP